MLRTLLVITFLLTVVSLVAALADASTTRTAGHLRRTARLLGLGAVGAIASTVISVAGTTASGWGFALGGYSSLAVLLVVGMGATVVAFSTRHLRDEPYQQRFVQLAVGIMLTGTVFAVTTNLVVLAIAWITTSRLTIGLVRTGPDAGIAARSSRVRRAFAIGDLAVVGAVAILIGATGSLSVGALRDAGSPALTGAGILLVVAALARSASGPFVRWLPDTLGAPTTSSALLHAGVVNGGALLLIRFAPAVSEVRAPAILAAMVGGITCVFAEAVMLTRPDVKGRLAWSTTAQMSFTLLLCGLGLNLAAGIHLVAHGFYKGALFLGSGSAVRAFVRQRSAPPTRAGSRRDRVLTDLTAAAVTGAGIVATVAVLDATPTAELMIPLALAWVAGTCAAAAGLRRVTTASSRTITLGVGLAAVAIFVGFTVELKHAIGDGTIMRNPTLSPLWVVPVLVALALVAASRSRDLPADTRVAIVWSWIRRAGRPQPVRVRRGLAIAERTDSAGSDARPTPARPLPNLEAA